MIRRRTRDAQFFQTVFGALATAGVATAGLAMARDFPAAAATFPRIVLVPLLVLALALLATAFLGGEATSLAGEAESALRGAQEMPVHAPAPNAEVTATATGPAVGARSRSRMPDLRGLVIVLGGLVPVLGFRRIGYVASAVVLMLLVPLLLGYRRIVWIVVAAVLLVLGLDWLFFEYLTLRPLPWRL
jgi:hypothetical protein